LHPCGKLLKRLQIIRENSIVDIHRIGQGLAKCTESKKTRQEIDFSEVLKTRQSGEAGRYPQTLSKKTGAISQPVLETKKGPDLISIGTVTRQNPNVSSLLVKHPVYKKDCWGILHSQINREKPYTRIREGTEIFLDPETKEVVWGKMREVPEASKAIAKPEQKRPVADTSFSERLVGAVRPLFGKPYGEINCYELLVKGLTNLGVRYQGAGGLGRKLMVMAREQGLPMNAYFNGEGLIAASGSPVYSKTLLKVGSPQRQADEVLQEIEPYLEKGQILSFSIHSKGHTGIVSRTKDAWTLINSGEMDHSLKSSGLPKGVGEESLEAEIRDWFELAKERRESLRITLGRLNEHQLVTYYDEPPTKPKKV
jgi:hypothetical protein